MARPTCNDNDDDPMHHNNTDDHSESSLEWPRLSSSSFSSSRPAPRWTTILGPSQVLVFPNFLALNDTRALIDYLQQEMKVQIDDKLDPTKPRPVKVPRPGYAFRDNDRIQFDSPEFAAMVWNKCGLRDRWKELWEHPKWGLETVQGQSITSGTRNNRRIRHAVGLSRNIRMYRYQQEQSFGAHYDESTVFYPKGKKPIPTSGTTTTGPGRGGAKKGGGPKAAGTGNAAGAGATGTGAGDSGLSYILPNGGVAVKPERGLLLVHKHGDECMLHEALIVQRGFKYVLRTDVVYEP
ncbi:hypothetical protein BGX29_008800 [Mortierella sp. GBA35]|nr:hypothetical protein BGX29_008800 [Mortierella sp. GBA35]